MRRSAMSDRRIAALAALAALVLAGAPAAALQQGSPASPADPAGSLECVTSPFSEADARVLGEAYVAVKSGHPERAPPARRELPVRLQAQLAECGRRHGLDGPRIAGQEVYAMAELMRRGMGEALRASGADTARIETVAAHFSLEEVTARPEDGFQRRARSELAAAAVPAAQLNLAIDYVRFVRMAAGLGGAWLAGHPILPPR